MGRPTGWGLLKQVGLGEGREGRWGGIFSEHLMGRMQAQKRDRGRKEDVAVELRKLEQRNQCEEVGGRGKAGK